MRLVIARHAFGGIGDHISCLIGAWWLAKRTGRTLVIDWRGSRFTADASGRHNCFHDYYQPQEIIGGVPVIADDRVANLEVPTPIFPEKWSPAILATTDHMKHTPAEIAAINSLVNSDGDRSEPTVVLNQWVDPHPPRRVVRGLLEELKPIESIGAEADRFWDEHIGHQPAIAIHVRHGNGENIGLRAAYWLGPLALARQLFRNHAVDVHRPGLAGRFLDNMPDSLVGTPGQRPMERRFYGRIAAAFRALARDAGLPEARPFLFTDAGQVALGLRDYLPTLVERPKLQLQAGEGPLHQLDAAAVAQSEHGGIRNRGIDPAISRDMFVELELMRRCEGLVYMNSGFSIFLQRRLDESRIRLLQPGPVNRLVLKVIQRALR